MDVTKELKLLLKCPPPKKTRGRGQGGREQRIESYCENAKKKRKVGGVWVGSSGGAGWM